MYIHQGKFTTRILQMDFILFGVTNFYGFNETN